MNIYQELQNYIKEFNKNNEIDLSIDTIRIEFEKQYKINELKSIGKWHKLNKSSEQIKRKLNKRLDIDEVTTVYQFGNENIYFYNSNKDKPKYRIATMVIFGMKQYHKAPPPNNLIEKLVNMLTYKNSRNKCNIDICYDMDKKANINNLSVFFDLKQYFKNHLGTDTHYINNTDILGLDKICIYNKAMKNDLQGILYRIEATISILNLRAIKMPLDDFKSIIEIARG